MTVKFEVELTDEDLNYYRKVMDETWKRNAKRDEKSLLTSARRLLELSRKRTLPAYVRKRLDELGTVMSMLEDPEWPLEPDERRRIIAATSYFAEPVDMIPDSIPGIGFLDDALMAELVIRELKDDLEGYREFCEFREKEETLRGKDTHVSREQWLDDKRRQIFLRIRRRRQEQRRHWSTDAPTDPILGFLSTRF